MNKPDNPLNLSEKSLATDKGIPTDPIEGLIEALDAIVEELAMHTELLAEIAYKQKAITEERYKEILE